MVWRRSIGTFLAAASGFALVAAVAQPGVVCAQPGGHPPPKVRVLVDEDPPFVLRDGGRWTGWAIDLWTEVARQADVEWEIMGEGNPDDVVGHLATGRADVGLGDISFTRERATRVDFTQPFFHSGVRILVLRDRPGLLLAALRAVATPAHLLMVVGLLCLVAAMSAGIYVLARRHNVANFPAARNEGIVESVYITLVALLKGQLDHKLLPGAPGRLLTISWMLLGTALVAYLSAAIAAALTVQHLADKVQEFDDLTGKTVAALAGHQTVGWLRQRGIQVVEQPDVDAAVEVLLARQVDAVVHDTPALAWWRARHPSTPVLTVGRSFDYKDYVIAVRPESPLRIPINIALVALREAGFFDELDRRWMGGARR
jgi:ABC-type amino acid transport substrate-binding protein